MTSTSKTAFARPPAEEVVPGVWSIRQPLKNALRYVWAYALQLDGGVVLIDAGLDDDGHLENLEAGLKTFGAALDDVQGAIFTHFHRDHYGLAGRIRERTGAWLALHEVEADFIAANAGRPVGRDDVDRWLARLGVSPGERHDLAELAVQLETRKRASVPPDRVLTHGVAFEVGDERFEIIHTPGHSPGHVCIVNRRRGVIFSGDHVLSETTPNVSIFPGTAGSPLEDYLGSLERVRPLAGLLDLPGHESRIEVGERATELLQYHAGQLDEVTALVAGGCETVWEIAARLWPLAWAGLPVIDRLLALGETFAHIVVLVDHGRLEPIDGEPLRWRRPAPPPTDTPLSTREVM